MFPVSRRVPLDSVVSLLAVAVRNDLAWYTPTRRVSRWATVSPVAARYNVLKLHDLWLRAPRASAYRKKSCKGYGSAREIIENASRDSSKEEHQRGRRDHASRSDARAPRDHRRRDRRRIDRWPIIGALRVSPRHRSRAGLQSPGQAARTARLRCLSKLAPQPPRRRRRLPGHVHGPGPQGRLDPAARSARSLAPRRRPPDGAAAEGEERAAKEP